MRTLVYALAAGFWATCLSSCFLVSIPVKATGELIEKSAEATGQAMNRGIHKVTRPEGSTGSAEDDWEDEWEDDYADEDLENLPPLLPRR